MENTALPKKIITTIQERVKQMVKDPMIQQKMMEFKTNIEAEEWLIKSAIATLIIPNDQKQKIQKGMA